MGSTKHIRNNGEHLNIHGHDNYQMPGAYKQMGDKNQNQSLGAYKLVGDQAELDKNGNKEIDGGDFKMMQPGKISGGAAKYIRESYGAGKIGDPPVKDPSKQKLDEVTLVADDKRDPKSRKNIIADGLKMKEERLANQKRGVMELRKQKTRDSLSMDMDNPSKAKNAFDFSIYGNKNRPNSGGIIEYKSSSRRGNSNEFANSNTSDSRIESNVGEDTNYKGEYYNSEKTAQIKKYKNLLGKNANTGANKKYKH